MQYYKEKFKTRRFYNGDVVDLNRSDIKEIGVKLDPLFIIERNQKLKEKDTKEYYSLENYKAHAVETLDFSKTAIKNVIRAYLLYALMTFLIE